MNAIAKTTTIELPGDINITEIIKFARSQGCAVRAGVNKLKIIREEKAINQEKKQCKH